MNKYSILMLCALFGIAFGAGGSVSTEGTGVEYGCDKEVAYMTSMDLRNHSFLYAKAMHFQNFSMLTNFILVFHREMSGAALALALIR